MKTKTKENYIPDGERCDGRDDERKKCYFWNKEYWRCENKEFENDEERVGEMTITRKIKCVRTHGIDKRL